ncbi:MAG: hypothetical protein RBQ67_05565 [Candidatus Cloacimonadaceae bacterium]|jgi:hypothetical protein|nr:hypothetical protein [Candidatus Cloacimonadaceae bacterium]
MKDMISTGAIKNIALVGISKNAGKTTVLNGVLRRFSDYQWGVFSTGIDGETEDLVFKTPKPRVKLDTGSIFCSEAEWLELHGSDVSILHVNKYTGRRLYIARAETEIETQITGPSALSDQRKMISHMHKLGAQKVLVDGSLDRKSIAFEDIIDLLILAVGASFGSVSEIIAELTRLLLLRDIPQQDLGSYEIRRLKQSANLLYKRNGRWYDSSLASMIRKEKELLKILDTAPEALYIPGSLTDSVFTKLMGSLAKHPLKLIFRHPECLKLSLANLQKLDKLCSLGCLIPFRLFAFALNATSIGKDPVSATDFRTQIRNAFPNEKFFDIMEIQ